MNELELVTVELTLNLNACIINDNWATPGSHRELDT